MKKFLSLILAAVMLLSCVAALAEAPEGYPEIPEGLDFGGETVYIYDWWSNGKRSENPDEETALLYEYRDWLEEQCNVKIVEDSLGDWGTILPNLTNMVMNNDSSKLCLVMLPSDNVASAMNNGLWAPWTIDLSAEKYQESAADLAFMTKNGKVYGVHTGAIEPRSCIYFNKRVLEEAGINFNDIYDAQKDGTWTWEMFEEMLKKVQRDIDNDGVIDIYGMTGSGDDFCIGLVISNGAAFFSRDENGKLYPSIGSDAGIEALQARIDLWDNYAAPQPADSNWDWFKDFWKQGTTGFYAAQTWQGFNDNSEMADMADAWGAVMFPKGPRAEDYKYMVCDNIVGVPTVFDEATTLKLQQLYDLYTEPTPGVDAEDSWIGNKYLYTDERAVDETYATMREAQHGAEHLVFALGSNNDIIGSSLMWSLWKGANVVVEEAMPAWLDMCAVFNGDMTQEEVDAKNAAAAAEAAAAAAAEEAAEVVETEAAAE